MKKRGENMTTDEIIKSLESHGFRKVLEARKTEVEK